MTRFTLYMPGSAGATAGFCYAERARLERALFAVLQDLPGGVAGSRRGFLRAAYREVIARYQSANRPETAPGLLRGVVRALDGAARQVETRVDDFRGLGIHVLVLDGASAYLLCGRDVPARVRSGAVLLPVAPGAAGAVEVSIETVRAQQDLFAQSLTDSLALYRFDLRAADPVGLEFFLGGQTADLAAVLDVLEVTRAIGGRVALDRATSAVLHVACAAQPTRAAETPARARARAPRKFAASATLRRSALATAALFVMVAAFIGIRAAREDGAEDRGAPPARATQARPTPREVRSQAAPVTEVASVTRDEAGEERARGFAEAWQRACGDAVTSSPVALEGTVVFGARDGNVYALDAASGEALWTHRAAGGVGASPAAAGDAVIACDYAGNVLRLARGDGRVVWKRGLGERIVSTPALSAERVFVATARGNVFALSRDSGRVLWKFRTRGQIRGSLAVARETVYVPSHDGRLYALVADSGARRWSVALGGPVASSPAVENGRVFVGTAQGTVVALDAASGEKQWTFAAGGPVNAWLRAQGGRVYAGSTDRSLYCIDGDSGRQLWKFTTGGVILSRPDVSGGRVVVTSYDGAVYCLDAATGEVQARFDTAEPIFSSPLVLGDRVYFGNNGGRFYGLELPR